MSKAETAPTATARELLPLKSKSIIVNARHFASKQCMAHMEDSVTLYDSINQSATLFRVIQKSRDNALNECDSVEFRWADQIALTQVDYTDGDAVYFLKPAVLRRRERNLAPWRN